MKIFLSIFTLSITVLFFLSLSVAYSWIFYFSATIHKNYMFLFSNAILLFISLNSRSTFPKHDAHELPTNKQPAPYCENGSLNTTVVEVGNDKEVGLLHVTDDDDDEKDDETLFDVDEESYGDDKTLVIVEETRDDDDDEEEEEELEAGKDDRTPSVNEETEEDELEKMEDDDETGLDMENDLTLFVVEETRGGGDEQEQGGSIDIISLEELHRKCEEFIRRMKKDIRIETLTVQCH